MAARTILRLGNPRLRQRSSPVSLPADPTLHALVSDLADTLAHAKKTTGYGRGIASPQIGELQRVVVLHVEGLPEVLFNPRIITHSLETVELWDACLCFLDVFCIVRRSKWIEVEYQDASGGFHVRRFEDEHSELLQHEIDHLDGILAIERMIDVKTICVGEEFEARYKSQTVYSQGGATDTHKNPWTPAGSVDLPVDSKR